MANQDLPRRYATTVVPLARTNRYPHGKVPHFAKGTDDMSAADKAEKIAERVIVLYSAVLEGKASQVYEAQLSKCTTDGRDTVTKLKLAVDAVAQYIFHAPETAYKDQKRYLQKGHLKMYNNKPLVFANRRKDSTNGYSTSH